MTTGTDTCSLNGVPIRAMTRGQSPGIVRSGNYAWVSLRAGAAAGAAAGTALCFYQYFGPLNYVGLSLMWPLIAINLLVGMVTGAASLSAWRRVKWVGPALGLATTLSVTGFWGAANVRHDAEVVLYVTDAVRADHLSAYGHGRDTSPALQALAKEPQGVLFRQAIAQGTYTWGGTPAILASIYPSMCDITLEAGLSDRAVTIPQPLKLSGYSTFGISANPHISREKHFDRGFDSFEDCLRWEDVPRADALNHAFLKWLGSAARGSRTFGFIFTTDAHGPYSPDVKALRRYRPRFNLPLPVPLAIFNAPSADQRSDLVALYDASIRSVDAAVGKLLSALRKQRRLDNTLFIFTADHGEAWWEHGEVGHGGTPYEEVIRIPLIMHFPSPVRFPRIHPSQRQPNWQVGQIDIMPTILDFVGSDRKIAAMRGKSLLPYLFGRLTPPSERGLLSESKPGGAWYRSWRRSGWKYLAFYHTGVQDPDAPSAERLFSIVRDPKELRDVGSRDPKRRRQYRQEMVSEVRAAQRFSMKPSAARLSPEALRRLKSLGYVK